MSVSAGCHGALSRLSGHIIARTAVCTAPVSTLGIPQGEYLKVATFCHPLYLNAYFKRNYRKNQTLNFWDWQSINDSSLQCFDTVEPGLASVYWSKEWWRWWWQLDYWSYKSCKAPVKASPTNQHPLFYRPDALPVAQPTVSKHWRENITFRGLAYPKLTRGSFNFVSDH